MGIAGGGFLLTIPSPAQIVTDFVVKLPSGDGTRPVVVEPMREEHARCWQTLVQPEIDSSAGRAYKDWRWRRIFGLTGLTRLLGQRPSAFALCVRDVRAGDWNFLPCTMTALVESYPAVDDPAAKSVFLWFLSAAPGPVLARFLGSFPPKLLGTAGLDIARTRSFLRQFQGRVGLHADAGGGDQLVRWYEQQGMTRLPAQAPAISPVRPNDGRYFYYTPPAALSAHIKLDPFRPEGARIRGGN